METPRTRSAVKKGASVPRTRSASSAKANAVPPVPSGSNKATTNSLPRSQSTSSAKSKGSTDVTKKGAPVRTSTNATARTRQVLVGNRRRGITRKDCKAIRQILLYPRENEQKSFTLASGKRVSIANYQLLPERCFGLELEESLSFSGRPSLPTDHPTHNDILKEYALKGLPSADILLNSNLNYATLAKELRNYIMRKIDVDASKLKEFPFTQLIVNAQKAAEAKSVSLNQDNQGVSCRTLVGDEVARSVDGGAVDRLATLVATGLKKVADRQGEMEDRQEKMEDRQAELTGLVTTGLEKVAGRQDQLEDNFSRMTHTIDTLAKSTGEGFKNVGDRQNKFERRIELHDTEIASIKSTLDELTTSAKKHWASVQREDMRGTRLFSDSPLAASSPLAVSSLPTVAESKFMEDVELSDLVTEEPNFLMARFTALLQPGADVARNSLLTEWQKKNLNEVVENLRGGSLASLKSEFSESDFLVMKGDVSELVKLESFPAFVDQLESSILVFLVADNPHDAVFVVPGDSDSFTTDEFLPAVSGAEFQLDLFDDGDKNVTILSRSSEAAVSTMTALLRLTAKGPSKRLELEASSKDDMKRGKPTPLPFPSDPLKLTRFFDLEIQKCAVTNVGQAANLALSFKSLKLIDCTMTDTSVADAFVDTVGSVGHLKSISFSTESSLRAPSDSFLRLVKNVSKKDGSLKLVFGDCKLAMPPVQFFCWLHQFPYHTFPHPFLVSFVGTSSRTSFAGDWGAGCHRLAHWQRFESFLGNRCWCSLGEYLFPKCLQSLFGFPRLRCCSHFGVLCWRRITESRWNHGDQKKTDCTCKQSPRMVGCRPMPRHFRGRNDNDQTQARRRHRRGSCQAPPTRLKVQICT